MSETVKRKIELLAPAGSYETFQAVINAGADAVYLGGSQFGARAYANNFDEEELKRAIDDAHIHGKQLYLTVNTLFKEQELETKLYDYLLPYYEQGLDAVIVQDIGALSFIRKAFPGLDIHTSTQMTITNCYGAERMKELGANRVVTAREMSFEEIKDIHDHVDIEIESFIHGALCYCYSGQCLLSSMIGGRSGNRGRCAQPCRLPYEVCDAEKKPVLSSNVRKLKENYILSPKDMCTIELLPELVECGIYSFKIEGRMKQAEYAAGVVSVYRSYIDRYLSDLEKFGDYGKAKEQYHVTKEDKQKLYDFGNRSGFTDGYYRKHNGREMITFQKPSHMKGNEALQEEIRERYVRAERKEIIKGKLKLSKEFPAMLEVVLKNIRIQTEGEVPQPALKQPLTREKVESNLRKTGSTPYEFSELIIEMEDDIFLPVQALNQLRRDALEKLSQELVKNKHRLTPETPEKMGKWMQIEPSDCQKRNLAVSIERREQLAVVCSFKEVSDVYLDSSCYSKESRRKALKSDVAQIHENGKGAFYVMPAVFRQNTLDTYQQEMELWKDSGLDGFVVKSFDELEFLRREFPKDTLVIFDHNMYTYNNRAKQVLEQFMPLRDTIPLELNKKEISGRENANSELLIYGNLPLMTSAQCIHANMEGCNRKPGVLYLKDRYGKYFPVKNNCSECYNTIYNTAPLILFDYRRDFEKMGICCYRICFTTEDEKQIQKIMEIYRSVFISGRATVREAYTGEYTNGHYKRGVE